MSHPLFMALDENENKYLSFKKNDLIKLCKKYEIKAEFSDNLEDLAFLAFRFERVSEMPKDNLSTALESLGLKDQGVKQNVIQLITFELCLVELLSNSEEELDSLCHEYEVEKGDLSKEELAVKLSVTMCS